MGKSESNKGCVGYFIGGIIKTGYVIIDYTKSSEPDKLVDKYMKLYGANVQYKYCTCEDPGSVFEEFKEKIKINNQISNIYNGSSASTDEVLKKLMNIKNISCYPKKHNKTKKKLKDDSDDSSLLKASKKESVRGESDNEPPKKQPKKKTSKKNDSSSDSSESSEDEKPKKLAKKSIKKKTSKKDDSSSDSSSESSEDEKPKRPVKKSIKNK